MKKTTFIYLFLFLLIPAFSANVTPEEAQKAALNFLTEKGYNLNNNNQPLTLLPSAKSEGSNLLYKFNISDNGFVIVSGSKSTYPILAYSFESNIEEQPAADFWLSFYEEQLSSDAKDGRVWDGVPAQWDYYLSDNFIPSQEKSDVIAAPLLTSQWNQTKYYNTYCPWDRNAGAYYDYRVPNGCVALAMAQVMYYYRYPKSGQGGVSYVPSPYPRQVVRFSDHTYNYDAMTDQLFCYNGEVAKLIYHAGVATQMGYSADGSGTHTEIAREKMISNFKYNSGARMEHMGTYPDTLVKFYIKILMDEIDMKRPLIYSGNDGSGRAGHAFILDGYDADSLFHVNWGWGGSMDGYFRISYLKPGSSDNFSVVSQAITWLYPVVETAPALTGHERLTATIGSFSNGNPHRPYSANPDKTWMLAAPLATNYNLKINKLDIHPTDDQLIIYNGPTVESGVKIILDASNIGQNFTVTADSVLVAFKSNGAISKDGEHYGFHISYTTSLNPQPQTSTVNLNWQVAETISPETVNGLYLPQRECTWNLTPTFVNGFSFVIKDFDLRAGDFIDVYNATTTPATLWKRFDIYEPPTGVYNANYKKLKIVFGTDNWLEGSGFKLEYYAILGIDDPVGASDVTVYPNPANNLVHVEFSTEKSGIVNLRLYDITGKSLFANQYNHDGGQFNQQLDVSHLTTGLYILHIETAQGKVIRKIAIN